MRLKDRVALITGSGSGIGRASALAFAREGAPVMIAELRPEAGLETMELIQKEGGEAAFVPTDVSDSRQLQAMVAATVDRYGKLHVLYNNAGMALPKRAEETSEDEYEKLMSINLRAVFFGCQFALPELKRTRGCIINTASMVGLVGQPNHAAYVASKGGVVALTKAMALDYAPLGIRVNCLCPGGVETPMLQKWIAEQPDPTAVRKQIDEMHPLGWTARPEEIAAVAVFLASDEASFITGVALPVEGGASLGY